MKLTVSALLLTLGVASADEMAMRSTITAHLALGGETNCPYKCAGLFHTETEWDKENGNAQANGMSANGVSVLNEYLGCIVGCESCNGGKNAKCMAQCKDKEWSTTNWWYNPVTQGMAFFHNCQVENRKLLQECLAAIPVPDTGGRAVLARKYRSQTQSCYDNTTFGIVAINGKCNEQCQAGATCTGVFDGTQECTTNDVTKQYTVDMCGSGLLKNIIEPDKACMIGCIQNLCQTGAECLGQGVWSEQTDKADCQLITPQQKGEKYTIIPSIFENTQSDLSTCCTQSRVCCGYKEAWAATDGGKRQRAGVCLVANEQCASGVPNFDLSSYGGDISEGETYPGDGCQALWDDSKDAGGKWVGLCPSAGFAPCPDCVQ